MVGSKERKIQGIIEGLKKIYPEAPLELRFSNPFELLVATILSAQCKDERVNQVTEKLFALIKGPLDLISIPLERLEELIRPTGFFRQKAKILKGCAEILERDFGGEVPRKIEKLTKLPGVGRKTAAMVLGNAYGIEEGIAIDRHVHRVIGRLGLSKSDQPEAMERELMALVPRSLWTWFSNALILHGRRVCTAKNPKCDVCALRPWCDYGQGINRG
ncbi:MAG: endonuclease III [Syntrophobacterales bacterium]|nr:endonuclease III [Syntrophobacterales bacterium]